MKVLSSTGPRIGPIFPPPNLCLLLEYSHAISYASGPSVKNLVKDAVHILLFPHHSACHFVIF